jgi:hypothetical protein
MTTQERAIELAIDLWEHGFFESFTERDRAMPFIEQAITDAIEAERTRIIKDLQDYWVKNGGTTIMLKDAIGVVRGEP